MTDESNPLQRTAQWFSDRVGALTASRLKDALDRKKDGSPGARRIALAKELLAERMTGFPCSHFVTDAMQRGIDEEAAAREAYELATGNIVQLVGFIPHPTIEFAGASPDGLLGRDGLVEFKNPQTSTHLDWILRGVVPDECHPQLLFQLACTRRRFVEFVSYDSRILEPKHRLFIRRFEPTAEHVATIEKEAMEFLRFVDVLFEQITTQAA